MKYLILLLLLTGCLFLTGCLDEPRCLHFDITKEAEQRAEKLCENHGGLIRLSRQDNGYGSNHHYYKAFCKYGEVHFR